MKFTVLTILFLLLNNFTLHEAIQTHVPSPLKSGKGTCLCYNNPTADHYNGHRNSKIQEQCFTSDRCPQNDQSLLDDMKEINAFLSKIGEDLSNDKLIVVIDLMSNGKYPDNEKSKSSGDSNFRSPPYPLYYSVNEDFFQNSFKCPAEFKLSDPFKSINPKGPLKSSTVKSKKQYKPDYNTCKINNTAASKGYMQSTLRKPS